MDNAVLVRFDNSFNTLFPSDFTKTEMNAFMYLVSVLSSSKSDEVTLDYKKIRDIIIYNPKRTTQDFEEVLTRLSVKLSELMLTLSDEDKDTDLRIFPTFIRNWYDRKLTVGINPRAKHLFTSCSGYTQFDLREYISLGSRYSKALFVYLKQFRSTGIWHVRIDDFKKKIGIISFSNTNCIQKCVYPAIEELNSKGVFTNLSVSIEHANEQGAPICALKFTFKPEVICKKNDYEAPKAEDTADTATNVDVFSMPEAFQSMYFTAEAMLKGMISEKNIFSITNEAIKCKIEPVTLKRIINISTSRDGVQNVVAYIISLIRRNKSRNVEKAPVATTPSAGISTNESTKNSFHNFTERSYDFDALMGDLCPIY